MSDQCYVLHVEPAGQRQLLFGRACLYDATADTTKVYGRDDVGELRTFIETLKPYTTLITWNGYRSALPVILCADRWGWMLGLNHWVPHLVESGDLFREAMTAQSVNCDDLISTHNLSGWDFASVVSGTLGADVTGDCERDLVLLNKLYLYSRERGNKLKSTAHPGNEVSIYREVAR